MIRIHPLKSYILTELSSISFFGHCMQNLIASYLLRNIPFSLFVQNLYFIPSKCFVKSEGRGITICCFCPLVVERDVVNK